VNEFEGVLVEGGGPEGKGPEGVEPKQQEKEGGQEGAVGRLPQRCFNCKCPRNFAAKCGSDGLTYQNECMMRCAKEKCPELTTKLSLETRNIKDGAC